MNNVLLIIILIVLNYFAGSISSAVLVSKYIKKVDIRKVGYKTAGGSNVAYNVGFFWGFSVGMFDVVKGIPILILAKHLDVDLMWQGLIGVAAVAGHCWPIWFNFSGGRGIGSLLGVILFLYPQNAICSVIIFILTIVPVITKRTLNFQLKLLSSPVLTLLSIGVFIFLSMKTPEEADDVLSILLLILILIRRLTAEIGEYKKRDPVKLFFSRLIFDNDEVIA